MMRGAMRWLVAVRALQAWGLSAPSVPFWGRLPQQQSAAGTQYDVIVIGGGPVGARAAIRAGELGKKALLCDGSARSETAFGGPTGLFSKALRDTAKRVSVSAYRSLGLDDDAIWTQIRNECGRLAATNAAAMRRECVSTGADVVSGEARLLASKDGVKVRVGEKTYGASHCLIATGSSAFRPKNIAFDGVRVFDSDSIVELSFLPRSIAISGAGIVAVEFAKIFRGLGSEVTMIFRGESPKQALAKSGLDKDLVAALVSDLRRSGVVFARGKVCEAVEAPASSAKRLPLKVTLAPADGDGPHEVIKVDAFLAAFGRRPRAPAGLADVGASLDEYGNVVVDADLRAAPGVFAAGDVLGRPFLASVGVAQGIQSIDAMFLAADAADLCAPADADASCFGANYDPDSLSANPFAFPIGIWSSPEIAWFGFTKPQALQRGIPASEGLALYKEVLRGIVFSPDGLLKLVVDDRDQTIIGVHIVGTDACEIIHYGMELVRAKRTLADVIQSTYSAVTFHELYQCAARACADPAAARLKRRATGAAWAAAQQERQAEDAAWE
mmetsp:Transcript_21491/g.67425  ORF Transcript_21491/g.67425 Transcript_21491/m.67425 type:complete len:556 (+) Transcript_21491:28-1695(+)